MLHYSSYYSRICSPNLSTIDILVLWRSFHYKIFNSIPDFHSMEIAPSQSWWSKSFQVLSNSWRGGGQNNSQLWTLSIRKGEKRLIITVIRFCLINAVLYSNLLYVIIIYHRTLAAIIFPSHIMNKNNNKYNAVFWETQMAA